MDRPLNEGAPLPSYDQMRWYKPLSPKTTNGIVVTILGDTFLAKWTHYVPPTLPCTETEDCHWCKAGHGNRYNGYIACHYETTKQLHMLCLTYGACKQILPELKTRGTLRGLRVKLARKHNGEKAPVLVQILDRLNPASVPPPFDVLDSLSKMWGINKAYLARGCRKLDAGENPNRMIRDRIDRKMNPPTPGDDHGNPA